MLSNNRSVRTQNWVLLAAGVILLATTGCATFLDINGAEPSDARPGGIAVNQRATYSVVVTDSAGVEFGKPSKLVAIDPNWIVSVNWMRMVFASGELVVKLNSEQTLKEVSLTGKTGAARAIEAATSAATGAAEIKKLRDEEAVAE